jgi:hypothetical protein
MKSAIHMFFAGWIFACAIQMHVYAQPGTATVQPRKYPWDMRPNKCFANPDAKKIAPQQCADKPDWPDFPTTWERVGMLFDRLDYDNIEQAEKELGFSDNRFETGEYYFHVWLGSMRQTFQVNPGIGAGIVKDWAARKGTEGFVTLADALVRYGEAWAARGSGYSSTVSPEAWAIYHRKLSEANQALDSASARLKKTGPWHAVKLEIAFQIPKQQRERLELLKVAIAAWPDYPPIYGIPMRFAHPQWGGSFELLDAIARFAVEQTKANQGAGLYPILYDTVLRGDPSNTLKDTKADWELMKQGFRDIDEKRGGRSWMWKNFAGMACQMRDRDEARRLYVLYDRLKKPSNEPEETDACRVFAMSKDEK